MRYREFLNVKDYTATIRRHGTSIDPSATALDYRPNAIRDPSTTHHWPSAKQQTPSLNPPFKGDLWQCPS